MNAAIDLGNTFSKIGFFQDDQLISFKDKLSLQELTTMINKKDIDQLIISSVGKSHQDLLNQIDPEIKVMFLNHLTSVPISNAYQTPETLGMDRLAATIGATKYFSDRSILIIDCGTCITYDFLDHNQVYQGGAISPGLNMRLKALNNFTSNLPLISLQEIDFIIGKNTESSILSGIINGTVSEMEGFIEKLISTNKDLRVILCGGDAKFFENRLKGPIFAVPELVLIGLNKILSYNAKVY